MLRKLSKNNKAFTFGCVCALAVTLVMAGCVSEQKKAEQATADSIAHVADSVETARVDSIKADSVMKEKETHPEFDSTGQLVAKYDVDAVMQRYNETTTSDMGSNHPGKKVIYLTFDDGPSNVTPKILKILQDEGVHATFFVTAQAPSCFNYIRQAHQQGNAIAAHTYSHKFSIYSNMVTYFEDLNRIQSVIKEQTGSRSKIIRFPGGSSNTVYYKNSHDPLYMVRLTQAVRDSGYQYVDWNADSGDASGINVPAATLIRRACSSNKNDICLLMHDTFGKNSTAEALPSIIRHYKELGYEFATLTSTDYVCHHGIRPYKGRGVKVPGKQTAKPDAATPAATPTAPQHATPATTPATTTPQHSTPQHSTPTEPVQEEHTTPTTPANQEQHNAEA